MTKLIKSGAYAADTFTPVADDAALPEGPVLVSLARFQKDRETLLSRNTPVGIRLQSNDIGVGQGEGAGKGFIVNEDIGLTDKVSKGQLVSTCGCSRANFPKDLPIGKVARITRSQSEQIQILSVKLLADLSQLDYVQVLHWLPSKSP